MTGRCSVVAAKARTATIARKRMLEKNLMVASLACSVLETAEENIFKSLELFVCVKDLKRFPFLGRRKGLHHPATLKRVIRCFALSIQENDLHSRNITSSQTLTAAHLPRGLPLSKHRNSPN